MSGRGGSRREMARALPRLAGMPEDERSSDYRSARTITGSDYKHYGGVCSKDLSKCPTPRPQGRSTAAGADLALRGPAGRGDRGR